MGTQTGLTDAGKRSRAQYKREWYRRNPEKQKAYSQKHWNKVAWNQTTEATRKRFMTNQLKGESQMENTYTTSIALTEAARAIYEGRKLNSSAVTSFSAFRKICQTMNQMLRKEREELGQQKAENVRELSQMRAKEANDKIDSKFEQRVHSIQLKLSETADKITSAKRTAISDYASLAPTEEMMRLLQTLNLRKSISNEEWETIVTRFAGNYQALAVLHDIAEDRGISFSLPFSPEDDIKRLSILTGRITKVINNIAEDPLISYECAEFLNYDDDFECITSQMIKALDNSFSSATPETLKEQLDAARKNALKTGNYDLWHQISDFIYNNASELAERVQSDTLKETARQLIESGMNAKEVSSYERKRDEVINNLENAISKNT